MSMGFDARPRLSRGRRERLVSALTLCYFLVLFLSLPVGPVVVSSLTDVSLLSAVRAVVPAIGVGYVLGMGLLLR